MKPKNRVPQSAPTHRRMRDVKIAPKREAPQERGTTVRSSWQSRSMDRYERHATPLRRTLRSLFWIFGLIALVLVIGNFVFQRAYVSVISHMISGPVEIFATTSDQAGDDIDLVYETMRITRETTQRIEVEAFTEEQQRAFGTITIYNEEPKAQRFVEETRFETPSGLIFKLPTGDGVTVPGASNGQPGTLDVTVYADGQGDAYNVGPSDFVIPGWREINNPKFSTQYARSSDAMSGGGAGRIPVVDDDEEKRIVAMLEDTLREQVVAQAWVQAPEDFVFFEDMVNITFSEPDMDLVNVGGVYFSDVTLSGTFETLLFDKESLGALLAREIAPEEYQGESVSINNLTTLESSLSSRGKQILGWASIPVSTTENERGAAAESASFSLKITGTPSLQMNIDEEVLLATLERQPVKNINELLASDTTIREARVHIKPFWRRRIPRSQRIQVAVEN